MPRKSAYFQYTVSTKSGTLSAYSQHTAHHVAASISPQRRRCK